MRYDIVSAIPPIRLSPQKSGATANLLDLDEREDFAGNMKVLALGLNKNASPAKGGSVSPRKDGSDSPHKNGSASPRENNGSWPQRSVGEGETVTGAGAEKEKRDKKGEDKDWGRETVSLLDM